MNILRKISALLRSTLPELERYDIERIPSKSVKQVEVKHEPITGNVRAGKEWKTKWTGDLTSESSKEGTDKPAVPAMVTLDEYDIAYLKDNLKTFDESRAKVMKWHWLQERSALAIEKYHSVNGQVERGFSERTAANFIRAFFQADERREQEGRGRQRKNPASPPSNQVEW